MATIYIPVGAPIGLLPGDPPSGIIATPFGEWTVNETQWMLWHQAFLTHTSDEMAEALQSLFSDAPDEAPTAEDFERWLGELSQLGVLVALPDDPPTAMSVLRRFQWQRAGIGFGWNGEEYVVIAAMTGDALALNALQFGIWRLAPHYSSLGSTVDEVLREFSKDEVAQALFELVTEGIGSLGFLMPPRKD